MLGGAPCPMVVSGEHHLIVAYYLQQPVLDFDGTNPRMVSEHSDGLKSAAINFLGVIDYRSGRPNVDDAIRLKEFFPIFQPWSMYVTNMHNWASSLLDGSDSKIKQLDWPELNHYVLSFHDSMIEVLAGGYRIEVADCSVGAMIASQHDANMKQKL